MAVNARKSDGLLIIVTIPGRRPRLFRIGSNATAYANECRDGVPLIRLTTRKQYRWECANRGKWHVQIEGQPQSAHTTLDRARQRIREVCAELAFVSGFRPPASLSLLL